MEKFQHPEGKIILLNGSVIDAIEKKTQNPVPPFTGMQLDTTGQYLQIGGSHHRKHRPRRPEPDEKILKLQSLFNDNAFLLYRNKEAVFTDSMMFLTPVDVGCHLAYTGRSGFTGATLGVWLEWWDSLEICRIDENGKERLITYFSGSPLSGANSCSGVLASGGTVKFWLNQFCTTWHAFMDINRRYHGLSEKYESYSLDETVKRLSRR